MQICLREFKMNIAIYNKVRRKDLGELIITKVTTSVKIENKKYL